MLAYIYDGSFDGLLTAVFDTYARREEPGVIGREQGLQLSFGQQTVHIVTDERKAHRVARGLEKIDSEVYKKMWTVFLSGDQDKEIKMYRYIRSAFAKGRQIVFDLANPDVLAVDKMYGAVAGEAHLLRGFVRFSAMEGGVFYSKITPKNSAVPLLMPHFADRYAIQPFLLHDPVHELVGVYDLKRWYLVETDDMTLPALAEDEAEYRRMWKTFYDTIAVRERENPICRRGHMPMRYWGNMTEFNFVDKGSR